jgi:hypothetical protein
MPQTCPHCGIALPGVIDAFCPECREDLNATPEEVADPPTLADMGKVLKPVSVAWGGFCIVVGTVSSILTVLGGAATRELEAALCGVIGLAVCAYWYYRVRQSASAETSITGREKTSWDSEQPK